MDLKDEAGHKTKMKPGKVAAQCCHAVLGAYVSGVVRFLDGRREAVLVWQPLRYKRATRAAPSAVRAWALTGQAKVCVKVPTEAELLELERTLAAKGIVHYLVEDAGRTQVAPGSRTVLAVGPAPVKVLDPITKHLKLY